MASIESNNVRIPDISAIWAIGWPDAIGVMQLLPPLDCDAGSFMAFPSEELAEQSLRRQMEMGFLDVENEPRVICVMDSAKGTCE